jgi:hypothetical protein
MSEPSRWVSQKMNLTFLHSHIVVSTFRSASGLTERIIRFHEGRNKQNIRNVDERYIDLRGTVLSVMHSHGGAKTQRYREVLKCR